MEQVEFDAARLIQDHPPRWRHPNKQAVFQVAAAVEHPFAGTIRCVRWHPAQPPPIVTTRSRVAVREGFYDYAPSPAESVDWHVNFADPQLFVAYGSRLLAQDELQVAEHPILGSVREALVAGGHAAETLGAWGVPTPVTITGVQRRCVVDTRPDAAAGHPRDLFGNAFARAPVTEVLAATRPLSPPTFSHILAMSAPPGGHGAYAPGELRSVLETAYTGFLAVRHESVLLAGAAVGAVVHTGFWGCGAFGGDRRLMTMLQALAADLAEVSVVFHAGPADGAALARQALADYASVRDVAPGVPTILAELLSRGFRWGVSDGN